MAHFKKVYFFYQALSKELQVKSTQLEILKDLQDKGCEKASHSTKVLFI